MIRKQRERFGFIAWLVLVVGFAATTACIPSCNMAIQDRERPKPEIPEQKPALAPAQSGSAANGGAP